MTVKGNLASGLSIADLCPKSESIETDDRDDWLFERSKGIGGSDVAAILGMSRWDSARDVWMEKTGLCEPKEITWAMRRGSALEPALLQEFSEQTDIGYEPVPLQRSKRDPWALGTPDSMAHDGGVIECKTASFRMRDEWEDGPADYAVIQGQWYCYVTGAPHLWVVSAVGDDEPLVERVERDDDLIATMRSAALHLWEVYVLGGIEPPLMWMDRDPIAAHFPDVERYRADGDAATDAAIRRRQDAVAQIKAAEKVKDQAEAEIINTLGAADHLVIDGHIAATRKAQNARVWDMGALTALLAERGLRIEDFKMDRASRVLRIAKNRKVWEQ